MNDKPTQESPDRPMPGLPVRLDAAEIPRREYRTPREAA